MGSNAAGLLFAIDGERDGERGSGLLNGERGSGLLNVLSQAPGGPESKPDPLSRPYGFDDAPRRFRALRRFISVNERTLLRDAALANVRDPKVRSDLWCKIKAAEAERATKRAAEGVRAARVARQRTVRCPACGGTGRLLVRSEIVHAPGPAGVVSMTCGRCRGRGRI